MKKVIYTIFVIMFTSFASIFGINIEQEKVKEINEVKESEIDTKSYIQDNGDIINNEIKPTDEIQVSEEKEIEEEILIEQEDISDASNKDVAPVSSNEQSHYNPVVNNPVVKEETKAETKPVIRNNNIEQESKLEEKPKEENNNVQNTEVETKIEDSITHEKGICTISDSAYNSWLNNYLNQNSSSVKFDTLQEAIDYGEYAARDFGYGYFYNSNPIRYEDDSCYKEHYFTRLYISNSLCENNDKKYLPRTSKENLKDVYKYLEELGFNCSGKSWYAS